MWARHARRAGRRSSRPRPARSRRQIAEEVPAAIALGLQAFYRSQDMELAPQLQYLQAELGRVLALEDAAEGIAAFLGKRKPVWKGR